MTRPGAVAQRPAWPPTSCAGPGWPALYDITDDWLLADRSPREHDRLVESERYLLDHCRQVVVCSPRLLETKSPGRAERVTLVPNAVDVDAYLADAPRPDDLPPGPRGPLRRHAAPRPARRRPLRGAGHARLLGTATFVLVGPVALDAADQTRLADAGAVLLGAREHTTIPAYLKNADVLVVPHVVTEFTDSLDPIKVYEYLAAARPVVSTPVAGFRDLAPGSVDIAVPAAFVDARTTLPDPGSASTGRHSRGDVGRARGWTCAGCSTRSGASVG